MRNVELCTHPLLAVGLVQAEVTVAPSDAELQALLHADAVPSPFSVQRSERQPVYDGIRALLRHTGYKPSGRGKPASELLAKMLESDEGLPSINNIVDVNNVVSVYSGLPISVFDADLLQGDLRIAPGGEDESYVFNPSGHELKLKNLLTVYHQPDGVWIPAGNGVRDSMSTKVHEGTRHVLAVLYSNHQVVARAYLESATRWYAELLERHAHAVDPATSISQAPG